MLIDKQPKKSHYIDKTDNMVHSKVTIVIQTVKTYENKIWKKKTYREFINEQITTRETESCCP